MKRQKIKRYRYSLTQGPNRSHRASPRKAVGVLVLCLCILAGAAFGTGMLLRARSTGWRGKGLHRYYVASATGERVKGLYEIDGQLYYFATNGFLKTGWVKEDGYVGHADADGKLARGETQVDGKSYYFQPATGQLYTGWCTLDGVDYCFDETGHPRTGVYEEDGVTWQLADDGSVQQRLSGWKTVDGVLGYYLADGTPAQGWVKLGDKDYFFVDGISQAGWVETDAGTRYLDGNGRQLTGWNVIDGQPYAFGSDGALKQGWDHAHEKNYYFVDGISQAGTFREGNVSYELNGSGSVQPVEETPPVEDTPEETEGEAPADETLLEETPQPAQPAAPVEEPAQTAEPEPQPAEETTPAQDEGEGKETA